MSDGEAIRVILVGDDGSPGGAEAIAFSARIGRALGRRGRGGRGLLAPRRTGGGGDPRSTSVSSRRRPVTDSKRNARQRCAMRMLRIVSCSSRIPMP